MNPRALLSPLLTALTLSACAASPRRAPPAGGETTARAGAADAQADAQTDARVESSDASTATRFPGARVLFEAPWPLAARPGLFAAVVQGLPDEDPDAQSIAWWAPAPARAQPAEPIAPLRALRLSVLDATGDGEADLVVWIDPASLDPRDARQRVRVFTWYPEPGWIRPAMWTSRALGDVADDDAVRAAAPTLRRFVMPEDAPDLDAVMLRVGFATTAQFRALLAPGGVTVCDAHAGNYRPHVRRCERLAPALLSDERVTSLRESIQALCEPADPDGNTLLEARRSCVASRGVTACDVPTGGPASTTVVFSGAGPARRIARIEYVAYEES